VTGGIDPSPVFTGQRAYRAAIGWTVVVVAASLVDPATILALLGASPTAGTDGSGGAGAFVLAHVAAYGVLAWLLVGGMHRRDARAVLIAIAVAAAVGVGVELLQAPVAARTASAVDALVNAVGATVGAVLRAAFERR